MASKSSVQDQVSLSYFDVLPNELVIKVMASLSVGERFHLIEAFPKLKGLAQVSGLKTRVFTHSEMRMKQHDLEKVLDPNGTSVKLDLDRVDYMTFAQIISDINNVMPNLQEVTIKNFKHNHAWCSCADKHLYWKYFQKFAVEEVTKFQSLIFESCELTHIPSDYFYSQDIPYCIGTFVKLHLQSSENMKTATYINMFTMTEFTLALCQIGISMQVVLEDLHGHSMNICQGSGDAKVVLAKFLKALCITLDLTFRVEEFGPSLDRFPQTDRRFAKVQVAGSSKSVLRVKITEDIDMVTFRGNLENA